MCLGLNGSCFLDNKHIMCFLIRFAYELCTGPCQRSQLTRFLKHYEFRRVYLPFWQGRDHIGGLAEEHEPSPVLVKLLKLQFFSPAFTVCEVHTTLISHQHNFITFLVIHLDILQWKKSRMIFLEFSLASKAAPWFILKKSWGKNKLLISCHIFLQNNLLQEIACSLLQNFNMLCEIF